MQTGRVSQVEAYYDVASPGSKKHVLIVSVKNMPRYKRVEFRCLVAIGPKEVEEVIGLKVGAVLGRQTDPSQDRVIRRVESMKIEPAKGANQK